MSTIAAKNSLSRAFVGGVIYVTIAALLELLVWGFTVDDAWIVSRVALHGAETGIYSFNLDSELTDGVTPLGFAHLVGALGGLWGAQTGLEFWQFARFLGLLGYFSSFFLVGWLLSFEEKKLSFFIGLTLTFFCLPAAVWAGAGLSGPIVGFLLLLGAVLLTVPSRRMVRQKKEDGSLGLSRYAIVWAGCLALGFAGAWRPELLPFILGLLVLDARRGTFRLGALIVPVLITSAPFIVSVVARTIIYGHALPLSFSAKSPDPQSGVFYALLSLLWVGVPWLFFSRKSFWIGNEPWAWLWLLHLVALFFAGGDWMPVFRLSAPLLPWAVWRLAPQWRPSALSFALVFFAFLGPSLLFIQQGDDLRAVYQRRTRLIEQGAVHVPPEGVVAAVDIGWLGMSTPSLIVDLAGVTDPTIALLPGGHTSKQIAAGMFSDRNIDTWVIRALDRKYIALEPLQSVAAAYWVDARLLTKADDLGFVGVATIPLDGTPGQYIVARKLK